MEPLPWVFAVFQYFGEILPLLESFDVLFKMRYILWVGALLGASDVIPDSSQYDCHLGFYQKLEITMKRRKLEIVNVSHLKYDIIEHFAAFLYYLCFFHLNKAKNSILPQNGLTTCYL